MPEMTIEQLLNPAVEHHQAGRLAEAEAIYRRVLAQQPNNADALHLLGVLLGQKGQYQDAVEFIRRAIAVNPSAATFYLNLGITLEKLNLNQDAASAYREALRLKHDFANAHNSLGNLFRRLHQIDEAIAECRLAVQFKPDFAEAYNNLGIALHVAGKHDQAIEAFHAAIRVKPLFGQAHNNLGNLFLQLHQIREAFTECHLAALISPDLAEARNNLATVLLEQGRFDLAINEYHEALRLKADYVNAHSNLIYTLYYCPTVDIAKIANELADFNRRHALPLKKFIQPHHNDPNPERKLRIGYVSSDFCDHASAFFLDPLLRNQDHEQFEIFCYAHVLKPDVFTGRFQSYADHWHSVVALSDQQLAEQIRADGIDILVDLKLHTKDNRLLVFAYKPAPVQATWLGYPGSTGLSTIDYRLTDPHLDPPGLDDKFYSEQSLRLPDCFWCYDPLTKEPPINELPADQNGFVTFGCLNNFRKINDKVLEIWAKVLRAMPNSRLLFLAPPGETRERAISKFEQENIVQARLEFIDHQSRTDYLKHYHSIDLSLDTLPCNGHTTTLDSLWMGVPVVSLSGKTSMGRAGKSILTNIGLPELIAQTPEEYIQIAVKLAKDMPRLAELRKTLRQRMEASPLMDAKRFARNIEAAYREMWQKWCSNAVNRVENR
ncbi:MAG TPA: tetratricopeptide repeat protein [Phycisphaerae bacterium]|nr:tetratricopeptide repeat protein [Phycisphaerae bacterium]